MVGGEQPFLPEILCQAVDWYRHQWLWMSSNDVIALILH